MNFLMYLLHTLPFLFMIGAVFIEPDFAPPCDSSFSVGKANVSFKGQVITGLATGVSFGISGAGGTAFLSDAFAWTIVFSLNGGSITGAPTILLEGTLDGTNWFTIDTYNATTSTLRPVSTHTSTSLPTRVLGIRARISVIGTVTGVPTVDVRIAA